MCKYNSAPPQTPMLNTRDPPSNSTRTAVNHPFNPFPHLFTNGRLDDHKECLWRPRTWTERLTWSLGMPCKSSLSNTTPRSESGHSMSDVIGQRSICPLKATVSINGDEYPVYSTMTPSCCSHVRGPSLPLRLPS